MHAGLPKRDYLFNDIFSICGLSVYGRKLKTMLKTMFPRVHITSIVSLLIFLAPFILLKLNITIQTPYFAPFDLFHVVKNNYDQNVVVNILLYIDICDGPAIEKLWRIYRATIYWLLSNIKNDGIQYQLVRYHHRKCNQDCKDILFRCGAFRIERTMLENDTTLKGIAICQRGIRQLYYYIVREITLQFVSFFLPRDIRNNIMYHAHYGYIGNFNMLFFHFSKRHMKTLNALHTYESQDVELNLQALYRWHSYWFSTHFQAVIFISISLSSSSKPSNNLQKCNRYWRKSMKYKINVFKTADIISSVRTWLKSLYNQEC